MQLPRWDLSELFTTDDEALLWLERLKEEAQRLKSEAQEKISAGVSAEELATFLKKLEEFIGKLWRVEAYAYLRYAADTTSAETKRLLSIITSQGSELSGILAWITARLSELPDETLHSLSSSPVLSNYRYFLELILKKKPHVLSPDVEKIVAIKNDTGRNQFAKFYDSISSSLKVERDGEELYLTQIRSLRFSPDRETRHWAWKTYLNLIRDNMQYLGEMFIFTAIDWDTESNIRGYENPQDMRHMQNGVEPKVVEQMSEVVASSDIPGRYWKWKASKLGQERLNLFDIVAPIGTKETLVDWSEGVNLILGTISEFSPRFGKIVSEFFEKNRVDAPPGKGKVGGAFSYSVGPDMPSYVLLNWNGTGRDLATLAHELGHGVHGILSGAQTPLNFHPPLVLAEVASTFFEFLLHDRLREIKPELASIPEKMEEVIATVFRQNAFYNFEKMAHKEVSQKGAQIDRLSEIFLDTYRGEVFQGAVDYPDDYRVEWAAIPHFVHTPFYVYAYTLAELVSLLIFKRYKEGMPDFEEKYTQLLSAGGSEDPQRLLKSTMAIDIGHSETWEEALEFIEEYFLKPIER